MWLYVMKKWLHVVAGVALATALVGCNNNDKEKTPPANDNNVVPQNENYNNGDIDRDGNDELDPGTKPERYDQNRANDKDLNKDENTPKEDIIEDDLDRKDKDNMDR